MTELGKRNTGLDIARIIAMLGIINLHLLGGGGILKANQAFSFKYCAAWLLEIWAYCSVDLFAILSGYLYQGKKLQSSNRIINLIATVIFYCFFITGIFAIFAPGDINDIKDLVYAIFPPLAGRYWYISCYVAAYFLFPYINTLIDTLNSGQRKKLFLVLVVIFSIIPNLLSTDLFGLDEGYSTAWLIICYILGSIIAREKIEVLQGREFLAFLGISAINMTIIVVGQLTLHRDVGYMLGYTSPLTLLSAIFVLQWAKRIQIKSMKIKSVIFSLSSFVFDVYILHCHYLVFDYRILDSFTWVTNYGMFIMVILIVSLSVSIYLFGSLIGIFRKKIFKLFRLNKLFSRVTIKIDKQLMM